MAQELKVEVRSAAGSRHSKKLRQEGKVPAVVYGEGKPATSIAIEARAMDRILHAGERVVVLKLAGRDAQALIKDVQYDALGEQMLHVDFNELKAGQKVRVRVPIVTKGVPKGHADGGVLNQALHELEVECLPTEIPDKFVVEVEPLGIGDAVHASDLKLPQGVVAITRATEIVAACIEPRKEEEVAAPVEGALLEPEVIGEKKEEGAEAAVPAEGEKEKKAAPTDAKKPEAKKPEAKK